MSYLDTIEELCQAGLHPGRTCRETKAATGKKLIGCVPYHTPDEVIYAGGCVPVGLWGGNPEFKQADRYLQSFCCGLLRAVVEYSMDGTYSILSGIVVPTFCDSMKCTLENLKLSAPEGMPVLGMSYGQQRKLKAGREYTIREYKRIRHEIEKIAGVAITNEKVEDAFALYEDYRGTLRAFEDAAAEHPEIITAKKRMMIIKAGLFMDKAVYTPKVKEISAGLKEEGPSAFDGKKIIITGIMAADQGQVYIDDEDVFNLSGENAASFRRRHIGIVFQKFNLIDNIEVAVVHFDSNSLNIKDLEQCPGGTAIAFIRLVIPDIDAFKNEHKLLYLDADFFVFSGHKVFAPTGIGVVYGKKELLEAARPYHGGGNMIADVTFERTIYNGIPNKFEAGTGSIADAVGLGAALQYLTEIGMPCVFRWEHELLQYGLKELKTVKGLHLVGTALNKASALAFKLDGYSDEEVGKRLDAYGVAVRTGHHCAQPVLRHFGYESTVRPTLALYNSPDDIDALVRALKTFA